MMDIEITDEFRDLVETEAHGEELTEDEKTLLYHDENVEKWRTCLVGVKKNIEVQMAERKADLLELNQDCLEMEEFAGKRRYFRAKSDYENWKKKALFFQGKIEERLAHIKAIRRRYNEGPIIGELCALLAHASNLIGKRWGEGKNWHTHLNSAKKRIRGLRQAFGEGDE